METLESQDLAFWIWGEKSTSLVVREQTHQGVHVGITNGRRHTWLFIVSQGKKWLNLVRCRLGKTIRTERILRMWKCAALVPSEFGGVLCYESVCKERQAAATRATSYVALNNSTPLHSLRKWKARPSVWFSDCELGQKRKLTVFGTDYRVAMLETWSEMYWVFSKQISLLSVIHKDILICHSCSKLWKNYPLAFCYSKLKNLHK